MAVTTDQMYAVFQSIDATLKALLALQRAKEGPQVASDADLDGQYGDPLVRAKDPRDWTGESQIGKSFSECPAEYLDLVAARLDFFAEKAEAENTLTTTGKPVAPYNRRDAARARGWAARIRHGYKPQAQAQDNGGFPSDGAAPVTDDEIAF
jgi:hypothetical protein